MTRASSLRLSERKKTENVIRKTDVKCNDVIILISDSEDEAIFVKPVKGRAAKVSVTPKKSKINKENDSNSDNPVTPPKLRKTDGNNKNQVLKTPPTPSTLLDKLDLNSPKKINGGISSEPKTLFHDQYQNARKALQSTVPVRMPAREKELMELENFIQEHLEKKSSGTLYISGPPGTGKTASLSVILQKPKISAELLHVYVNCTSIKSSGSIYARIAKELNTSKTAKSEKEYLAIIDAFLTKNHKMILLVLDEIDQLDSKRQSVLYTIFEWPSKPNSKMVLIGIANALDLTDRILPRLQTRCELKPKLMHFAPYSKQQIIQIFTERLKEANVSNVFSSSAIQLLAAKVAAVSGDVRRALDIGRRVVELAEQHQSKDVLRPVDNLTMGEKEMLKCDNPQFVDVKEVVNVLNNVYGTSQNLNDDCDDTFPLQQKIIVCALLLVLRKARNKDVNIGKLHDVYKKVCSKRNLTGVDQAEFVGLCSLIETRGIIRVTGKKEPRLHKVTLEWDDDEVAAALKDKQLMSTILQDVSCIGKM